MTHYDVSIQIAAPVGPHDSLVWFIQFVPVGRLHAANAEDALAIARERGWRAPAISPADPDINLPPLPVAPLKLPRTAAHKPLPVPGRGPGRDLGRGKSPQFNARNSQ